MPKKTDRLRGFFFSHQEIATDLIRKQGLHEGRWKLTLEVGFSGTSLPVNTPDGSRELLPAGLVFIAAIGITPTDEENNLTVDAAEVNPAPKPRASSTKRPGKKRVAK